MFRIYRLSALAIIALGQEFLLKLLAHTSCLG